MHKKVLGRTGLETSQLGFGCVQLTTYPHRHEAVAILEHAFALGITHFDVARVYGFGRAESILGEFLRGKRSQVTIATKFGLQPPAGVAGNRRIVDAAKKILSPFPSLLRRAKAHGSAMQKSGVFNPEAAIKSLEISLRELNTDYVDILLLHEATVHEAADEALIASLHQQIAKGKVRSIGVASDSRRLGRDPRQIASEYSILQFDDNALARNVRALGSCRERALVTHSIFKPATLLGERINNHLQLTQRFSTKLDLDLTDPSVIRYLLLSYALQSNIDGIVLFSSTNPAHVSANALQAESRGYENQQLSVFLEFVDELLGATASSLSTSISESPSNPRTS